MNGYEIREQHAWPSFIFACFKEKKRAAYRVAVRQRALGRQQVRVKSWGRRRKVAKKGGGAWLGALGGAGSSSRKLDQASSYFGTVFGKTAAPATPPCELGELATLRLALERVPVKEMRREGGELARKDACISLHTRNGGLREHATAASPPTRAITAGGCFVRSARAGCQGQRGGNVARLRA